jgi:hypothetical protein
MCIALISLKHYERCYSMLHLYDIGGSLGSSAVLRVKSSQFPSKIIDKEFIHKYAKAYTLLHVWDTVEPGRGKSDQTPSIDIPKFIPIELSEAYQSIEELKQFLISKGEASNYFGSEYSENSLSGILLSVEQSFNG